MLEVGVFTSQCYQLRFLSKAEISSNEYDLDEVSFGEYDF